MWARRWCRGVVGANRVRLHLRYDLYVAPQVALLNRSLLPARLLAALALALDGRGAFVSLASQRLSLFELHVGARQRG
jgi:hypothetical protein